MGEVLSRTTYFYIHSTKCMKECSFFTINDILGRYAPVQYALGTICMNRYKQSAIVSSHLVTVYNHRTA